MAESGQTDARVAEFITDLRQTLAEAGDPARAEQQRAYLKSEMAMYGVGVPDTRRLARRIAAAHSDVWSQAATWEVALRRLWDGAARRMLDAWSPWRSTSIFCVRGSGGIWSMRPPTPSG